jgi:hypothetical protein
MPTPQTALKYEVHVTDDGRIELPVPFAAGAPVVVFVMEKTPTDAMEDLVDASASSLSFWDNPLDDEDWNDA